MKLKGLYYVKDLEGNPEVHKVTVEKYDTRSGEDERSVQVFTKYDHALRI